MYTTIRQLVEQSRDKPIYQVVLEDEQALTQASEEEIWEGFRQRWQVMQASAARALEQPQPMVGDSSAARPAASSCTASRAGCWEARPTA